VLDPGAFTQAKSAPLWVRLWPLWIALIVLFAVFGKDIPDVARNLAAMRLK
jgi:hypothetical protein